MQPTGHIVSFLLLSCCLWELESQNVTSTLAVTNGGNWGKWGEMKFCPTHKAKGFSLKVHAKQGFYSDDTSLNGIRLLCTDGSVITSTVGKFGSWSDPHLCPAGFLTSFSLRVAATKHLSDNTGATNIKFKCSDGTELEGNGHEWGDYGSWSESCDEDGICGIQTKVEIFALIDNTGLNDVKFFCCA